MFRRERARLQNAHTRAMSESKPAALTRGPTSRVRDVLERFVTQPALLLPPRLCALAARGDLDALKTLLASAPPNAINLTDYDGRSPLHLAAEEGHLATVRFIVELGGDVNCADRWGITPLAGATLFKRDDIAGRGRPADVGRA